MYLPTVDGATANPSLSTVHRDCVAHPKEDFPGSCVGSMPAAPRRSVADLPAGVTSSASSGETLRDASAPASPDGRRLISLRIDGNQLDQEQAIGVAKLNAAVHLASKDDELMPECSILGFEPALRLEGRTNSFRARSISAITAANVMRFSHWFNTDGVFGTHNGQHRYRAVRRGRQGNAPGSRRRK
jgi:hypothetical protein